MLIQGAQGPGGAADVGLGKLQNFNFPSFNPNQQQSQPTMPQGLGGGIKPYQGPFQIPQAPGGSGDVFGGFTATGAPQWTAGRDQNTWQTNQLPTQQARDAVARQFPQSIGTQGPGMPAQQQQPQPQPMGLGSQSPMGATAQDWWKRTQPQTGPQPAQQQQPQAPMQRGPAGIGMFGNNPDGSQANPRQAFINNLVQQPPQAYQRQPEVANAPGGGLAGNSIGVGLPGGVNPNAGRNVVGGTFQHPRSGGAPAWRV